jgi:cytochrome c-type biogenesis protein CcmH
MTSLLITLFLIACFSFGVFFFIYHSFRLHKKSCLSMGILFISVMGIGYYLNPDLWRWYQHLKQQQALAKAKAILAEPKKIAMLKIRLHDIVKLHPTDAKAWFLLGRLAAAENNWKQASFALKKAYDLNHNDIKTAIFYTESLIRVEQHLSMTSRQILLDILKHDDNQPDALLMLAEDANMRQCPIEAIEYWKRVLILLPKDTEMYESLDKAISNAQKKKSTHCVKVQDQ